MGVLRQPLPSEQLPYLDPFVAAEGFLCRRSDGEGIRFEAREDTRALVMSGEPIGEAIVSYGPFVMNSDAEIRAAFRDYRNGEMGVVP